MGLIVLIIWATVMIVSIVSISYAGVLLRLYNQMDVDTVLLIGFGVLVVVVLTIAFAGAGINQLLPMVTK